MDFVSQFLTIKTVSEPVWIDHFARLGGPTSKVSFGSLGVSLSTSSVDAPSKIATSSATFSLFNHSARRFCRGRVRPDERPMLIDGSATNAETESGVQLVDSMYSSGYGCQLFSYRVSIQISARRQRKTRGRNDRFCCRAARDAQNRTKSPFPRYERWLWAQ